MNGELFQIASIVAAGKKAMQLSESIRYTPVKYEGNIEFAFLPVKDFEGTKKYTAPTVSAWFEQIKQRKVEDIKLLCPYTVKDRHVLGFSNTSGSSILCFHKDKTVTYFRPNWQFDSTQKKWNILYSEYAWPNPPEEKPRFADNTAEFKAVLSAIKELAEKIDCEQFAAVFSSAIDLLEGRGEYPERKYIPELPPIPPHNLQLFEAASVADVFGAMGSWNDGPEGMARDKGVHEEYDRLSAELLKSIRLAALYAINEW